MQVPKERLGSFYLGAEYDLKHKEIKKNIVNYDARDLTTHAVCIGMTGSGKTGLCVGLLEEAALDKVPAILIDPKGDITNLLLQFPEFKYENFLQWINPDDARRKGKTREEYAKYVADLWRDGLTEWGIGPDRIRLLKESAEFTIYTPGSNSGFPVSILSSLASPGLEFEENAELIREKINGTVSALMELVGIDSDPVRSREAILLSRIFEHYWKMNKDLDLAKIISSIQNPPVRKLGVFDVDTFYPEKDRFELAMAFNNLIASSSFQSWLQGESLEINRLLYTEEGKPRHSIFYIAHLSERERMFFVTLLLENIITWIRKQTGTTSLRAILYFDEVFGFFPPVAEPPSKRPLLTLLKQARAYGLGVLLVTQNPVDIDYKGLTNAGTWFIGKLQTERDKDRVLHGLKGAIAEAGESGKKVNYDSIISQLRSRVFLMHNVHEEKPKVFHTRWVMSYLRGPLTRPQVKELMQSKKRDIKRVMKKEITEKPVRIAPQLSGYSSTPTALDPSINQIFLPLEINEQTAIKKMNEQGIKSPINKIKLLYEPAIIASSSIRFFDRRQKIDEKIERNLLVDVSENLSMVNWEDSKILNIELSELTKEPQKGDSKYGPIFADVPEGINTAKEMSEIRKSLENWLYANESIKLKTHQALNIYQNSQENEIDFLSRLRQSAKEQRDSEIEKLRQKYEKKYDKLEKKMRKLERELIDDEAEYEARKKEEIAGIGGTVLGVLLGRRSTSTATSIARRRRLTSKAKREVQESTAEVKEAGQDIEKLEEELKVEVNEITNKWDNAVEDLITEEIRPRRTDVNVALIALAWLPFWLLSYDSKGIQKTAKIPAHSSQTG